MGAKRKGMIVESKWIDESTPYVMSTTGQASKQVQLSFSKAILDTTGDLVSSDDCEYCQWIREIETDPDFAYCRIHGQVEVDNDENTC